jgi:hypothetical protein
VLPRSVLTTLVFALPILVVSFAVLMGGSALARATDDLAAARALQWIGVGILMLTVVDLVLLFGVLGLRALSDKEVRDTSDD